jgi:hypothetical protein
MLWDIASAIDLNCNTVDKPERIDPASPEINFLLSITFSIDYRFGGKGVNQIGSSS